jgi:GNAT superfamily N-acetyltransferase
VQVREWDPKSAPAEEIEAVLRALNTVIEHDLPGDPRWQNTLFREYLSITLPGERRISWLANDDNGDIVGEASILMLGDIGVIEILVVPSARRSGVAADLLRAVTAQALAENFSAVGVEVIGGTPAQAFYARHGFGVAITEQRSVLALATIDWLRLSEIAASIGAGYEVEYYANSVPFEMHDSYARAKDMVRDTGPDQMDLKPSSYEPERLKASLETLHARGQKPHIVVAVHTATGDIAGLTEVVVPAQHPTRADQYDTVVVPEHRGYGIGRAIKARMLFEIRSAEPQVREVQTWHADDNEALVRVNSELGFVPDRTWYEYEADVVELAARLGID